MQHQVCILAQQVRTVDPQSDMLASAVAVSLGLIPTIFHDAVSVSSSAGATDYYGVFIEIPGLGDLGVWGVCSPGFEISDTAMSGPKPKTHRLPTVRLHNLLVRNSAWLALPGFDYGDVRHSSLSSRVHNHHQDFHSGGIMGLDNDGGRRVFRLQLVNI